MKDYKIFSFDEIKDEVGLTQEAWRRVRKAPAEEYDEALRREIGLQEDFLELLKGKTLEEQMGYYRIVKTEYYGSTAYGKVTKMNKHEFGCALEDYPGLKALIVDDGVLIGVRMKSAFDPHGCGRVAFPYQSICTYYGSDNNGSGYKTSEDYAHLCCVMPEEE